MYRIALATSAASLASLPKIKVFPMLGDRYLVDRYDIPRRETNHCDLNVRLEVGRAQSEFTVDEESSIRCHHPFSVIVAIAIFDKPILPEHHHGFQSRIRSD